MARAADSIIRIEDGVIKASLSPSQIAGQEPATTYLDQLRKRLAETETQLQQLDEEFRSHRITGDEYADQRVRLKQVRSGIMDELQRQGVIG